MEADGKLYITIGERLFWERDNPPIPIAQDVSDRRGKIYRINADGSIPADNPDFGPDAIPGLYAIGIRAAQGITMEPKTGSIWFSEHGTIQGDEINLLKAGANYGWPNVTSGKLRSSDYTPPKLEGPEFTPPVWFWPHTVAPTGLTFYNGNDFPHWKNNLIVPGTIPRKPVAISNRKMIPLKVPRNSLLTTVFAFEKPDKVQTVNSTF